MAEDKQHAAWAARVAAIGARGEEIKQASAEHQWICRGIKPALLPDKPVVINLNNSSGPEVFEAAARKDAEGLQLRARIPDGVRPAKPR